ncbi:MAG: DUF6148 family protein [Desulfosalsimonas sp.]
MTTLSELKEDLSKYKAARDKILTGQEYTIGGRRLRRPDLAEIEKRIEVLEARILMMESNSGKIKTSHAVFGG